MIQIALPNPVDIYSISDCDCYDQTNLASVMKLNRWLAFVALSTIVGCHRQSTAERQLQGFIITKCHAVWPCAVELRGATSFEWDELYVFKDNASKADIENATHATLSKYRELTSYLIFLRAGKAVRIESEPTDVEHPINNELVFEMPEATVYRAFPVSTGFIVTQVDSKEGSYFYLRPK